MVRKLSLVLALVAGLSSFGAWSLGLGEVNLKSYLNQPLRARIEILTIDQSELNELTVRLASEAE